MPTTIGRTGQDKPGELTRAWREWKRKLQDPITLFTFMLVIVGALQWYTLNKTDETLRLQQRAWLTPLRARSVVPAWSPKTNEGIDFVLEMANSGREPATGVVIKIHNDFIDGTSAKQINVPDLKIPKNTSCAGLHSVPESAVVPPTGVGPSFSSGQSSIYGEPRMVADDKIINGDKFYLVEGCIAYVTLGEERHSSFCYVLHSRTGDNNQRRFQFIACSSGFDAP
jgi:hypothetical protein